GLAENTYDLFVGKTLLHGDVLMWLMKTLLTSRCINQRGAGHPYYPVSAMANRISGTVNYAASVNEKGEVTSVETTGAELFFRETRSAMRKCKYEPGKPGIARGTIRFRPSQP
ncbi:TonB family protein, partial [Klebsiella quasipneumoniae]|uniref:TonB family protein n=1 Tax=Klebsiella quasipneumoniae TaxID=1463165 RepID=UPI001C49BCEB